MLDRQPAANGRYQKEAAGNGYFAPLASAKGMLLTTFRRDGTPVSAAVPGVVDGGRAYFGARGWSGSAKRLRHNEVVQVTPCSVWGLCTQGAPLDAVARPLLSEEASEVVRKLALRHPLRRRLPMLPRRRTRRWQAAYYELMADYDAESHGVGPEALRAPHRRSDEPGTNAAHVSQEALQCKCVPSRLADHGVTSIASIWPAPVGK